MRQYPLRLHYFRKLILLLLSSYIIFFSILCLVEFRKAIFNPEKFIEASHEVTVFFLVGLASLPLAIFLAWKLTQSLLRPLAQMVKTAESISGGKFSQRISLTETYDELDQLAVSFNLAFDRYEATLDQLKNFSGDAAHQLRTPLAAVQSIGETALLSSQSGDSYKQSIEHMLESLNNLKGIVNQLLQLSELEPGLIRQSFQDCNPAKAIRATVERFSPLIELKNISVESQFGEPFFISGKPDLLEQALANLLDNAVRHTSSGGSIRITQNGPKVVVEDSGTGIDPTILPHVFEQFRKDREHGQTGLGLAIVERIIQLHKGSIIAENREEGGARFTIDFSNSSVLNES